MPETVELMPNTWANVLPLLLHIYAEAETEHGRNVAVVELRKMAALADRYNALRQEFGRSALADAAERGALA